MGLSRMYFKEETGPGWCIGCEFYSAVSRVRLQSASGVWAYQERDECVARVGKYHAGTRRTRLKTRHPACRIVPLIGSTSAAYLRLTLSIRGPMRLQAGSQPLATHRRPVMLYCPFARSTLHTLPAHLCFLLGSSMEANI